MRVRLSVSPPPPVPPPDRPFHFSAFSIVRPGPSRAALDLLCQSNYLFAEILRMQNFLARAHGGNDFCSMG